MGSANVRVVLVEKLHSISHTVKKTQTKDRDTHLLITICCEGVGFQLLYLLT